MSEQTTSSLGSAEYLSKQKKPGGLHYHFTDAISPINDSGDFTLLDLLDLNDLQQIQDSFAASTNVASLITDLNGNPITRPSNFSKICGIVRSCEKGFANCRESARVLGEKSHQKLAPAYQKCLSCGFIDASAPIIVANRHIANWLIGQVNPSDVGIERLGDYAREIGLDPEKMKDAYDSSRNMPMEQFEKILTLLWLLAKEISQLGYKNLVLSLENNKLQQAEREIRNLNQDLQHRIKEVEHANSELHNALATLQETQTMLIQTEKMASLGSLVAGIAHEINTPIGVSVTAISFLEQESNNLQKLFSQGAIKKSDLVSYFNVIDEAVSITSMNLQNASNIIQSFKKMAVDQSCEDYRTFNVKQYIGAVLLSLRPNLKKTKHFITVNCDEFLDITSYPGAFSQVITNLIMNSLIHAYDDGHQGNITINIHTNNDSVILTYSDDGKGIPPENLEKIFDPFFTTRRGKGGTGLGLNILFNIITQTLKGTVTCQSQLNKGTSFIINIPVELEECHSDTV